MARQGQEASNANRLSVNLVGEGAAAIRQMAEDREITVVEALRRAISVMVYLDEMVKEGAKILVEDESGKVKEIVWIH